MANNFQMYIYFLNLQIFQTVNYHPLKIDKLSNILNEYLFQKYDFQEKVVS